MALKWWEKTVEYHFIRNILEDDTLAMPLDGKQESAAGDSIFSEDDAWFLVEFKKDETCLKSEEDKFENFGAAREKLCLKDSHHFLIYGDVENNKFILKSKTYFSDKTEAKRLDALETISSSGVSYEHFKNYINALAALKKTYAGSGSRSSSDSFGFVACVNKNKEVIACMNFSEAEITLELVLQQALTLKQTQEKKHTNTFSI